MKMHNINNQKGFTLVEAMVALLITGIMMVLVMQFVFAQMKGFKREQMLSDTQQNLRAVMDEMERDIRMAGAGIPRVPIYTGYSYEPLPGNTAFTAQVYPLYIASGTHPISSTTGTGTGPYLLYNYSWVLLANGANDSIIVMYKDPERTLADTTITADMVGVNDNIQVPATSIKANTGFERGVPFIITDASGTKADLFMVTGVAGNVLQRTANLTTSTNEYAYNATGFGPNIGHGVNFNAAASASPGYRVGDKIFAVKVIRYDFSPDVDNFPITKLVNNDGLRDTSNAVGEFFGNIVTTARISPWTTGDINDTGNTAMVIQYAPYMGATVFTRGMPAAPYNIGTVRITLTARTAVKTNSFGNNSLIRTRTLTSDIQPRNYNGN